MIFRFPDVIPENFLENRFLDSRDQNTNMNFFRSFIYDQYFQYKPSFPGS